MPRGPRIDEPGMVHHVILRGVEKRRIFADDRDREELLSRLDRTLPALAMRCFAWALLPNHVHLVVQTRGIPLDRVMASTNTGYAMHFNRRHDRVGHLFQSRYRSRPIEDDGDLLGVILYVHRNPWKHGVVRNAAALECFPWVGHGALLGRQPARAFHAAQDALALIGPDASRAREALRRRMLERIGDEPPEPDDPLRTRSHSHGSRPLDGDLPTLVERVCDELGVEERDLAAGSRRAAVCEARVRISAAAVARGASLESIAPALGVTPSALCQALKRRRQRPPRQRSF